MRVGGSVEDATVRLAAGTSRRSFLSRLGTGIVAIVGGPLVAHALRPEAAHAENLCGYIGSTGSCPHPFHPRSRIDKYGYPVHPKHGYPVDDDGEIYVSGDQKRRRICQERVPDKYPKVNKPRYDGSWYRCCNGRIRQIADCCSEHRERINNDGGVIQSYCDSGRWLFCIAYRDTNVRC